MKPIFTHWKCFAEILEKKKLLKTVQCFEEDIAWARGHMVGFLFCEYEY